MRMTKTILNYKLQDSNFNVNEDFVMFLISKLYRCFINGFTSRIKSQSIVELPTRSAHIHWILDLEGEVHSIWDLWSNNLQEYKGNIFFEVGWGGQHISVGFIIISKGVATLACSP
jgi:hypothetical protein